MLHTILTIQGFFLLFVVILLSMILYLLLDIGRAMQRRVMAEVHEQRAVRRPELNRDGERRRGENVNYNNPTNRNRHPTENDERQGKLFKHHFLNQLDKGSRTEFYIKI